MAERVQTENLELQQKATAMSSRRWKEALEGLATRNPDLFREKGMGTPQGPGVQPSPTPGVQGTPPQGPARTPAQGPVGTPPQGVPASGPQSPGPNTVSMGSTKGAGNPTIRVTLQGPPGSINLPWLNQQTT